MNRPVYTDISANAALDTFRFVSTGPKGDFTKLVRFYELDAARNLFQLALLDVLSDGTESDIHETNNDDMRKVLATVVAIIKAYTERHPERYVLFWGSTEQRQLTYHRILSLYATELSADFMLYGIGADNSYETFNPLKQYSKFLVRRK